MGEDRLLTELTAEVGPGGVMLAWSVDEDRAGRIDGFSCVFRSPGHLRLGAPGSAGTKALLRPGPDPAGGWELRLHTSYPFGSVYAYGAEYVVAGWGRPGPGALQAELWNRTDCPPAADGHATHDVALALSTDAAGGRALQHSGYGWCAVAPVGLFPERVVATKGGLSYGEPATAAPAAGTVWAGRVTGHLFWQRQRWALGGDTTLEFRLRDGRSHVSGRIDNTELVPLDPDTLEPTGPALRWRSLTLDPAADGAWSGQAGVGPPADQEPPAMPPADRFEGDWRAAAYGPGASEVAGRLRLWTPLAGDDDPADAWPAQAVLVAGFGGTTR